MPDTKNIRLVLEGGLELSGFSFGYEGSVSGEVVFNTAMTGYPESLTDPSYKGQILVLTYPLIGNYGVPPAEIEQNLLSNFESNGIHISGLVISDYSYDSSHWKSFISLSDWLVQNKIPAVHGIDTRMITKIIRNHGTLLGKLVYDGKDVEFLDPNRENLVAMVSAKEKISYGSGKYKIILVDCGVKYNIIRRLLMRDTTVVRVPWNYDFNQEEFDGLFISNGPGDPVKCETTINNLSIAIEKNKPIFGICLGNQLLALAAGGKTYKLKFGHRSHNQPVILADTNKCFITSQNHGFAVDYKSLGTEWKEFFRNLNDGSNEGIIHKWKKIFSTQFHPEASSGPTDTDFLFDQFIDNIKESRNS